MLRVDLFNAQTFIMTNETMYAVKIMIFAIARDAEMLNV